ncbi:hypothetical protein A2875_01505 [Candidatus Gottesmanbacteria bacterium RIFCSPHIGHO2_01_FULL_46_14]|uniref:Uncharacterized protein n=2 Tax=Candidatus Gottesmaniibacteriota TaxID=1752720 RepID=A0A1F5ZJZ9_9BACT|nr:MAG: hypothetical protein A2875_01505 [Candidatus Gottesmanbacteria bacterium RIFCSPHIGHO2_01_FULL_46_14]OGG30227.1 MAG: hypothetical protein A2971_02990 [Candidatus Gottesmanbacteria bacterium RIFCSPLOWO2_01_FULL_46_21]
MEIKKNKKSRIPKFKNYEEEANWWDTHSLADYKDEFQPVKVRFAKNLSHGITVRLDPKTIDMLRKKAHVKGIGPTTLARMWILEHLATA